MIDYKELSLSLVDDMCELFEHKSVCENLIMRGIKKEELIDIFGFDESTVDEADSELDNLMDFR